MKTISLLLSTTLLATVAALAQIPPDPPREMVTLARTATPKQVSAGSTFAVTLSATSPQAGQFALYGHQFDLAFDPAKLQAIDVAEGDPFKATNVSDFIPGAIDNTAGVIHTSYDTLEGSTAAVRDQSALLAVIRFKALQSGNANITVQFPVLIDQTGALVPITVQPMLTVPILDATPPVVTPQVTGTLGSNGWYTSNVSVSWTATDSESGVTSAACPATVITTDTAGQTVTCNAVNGAGLSTMGTVTIKRDATVPVITPVIAGTLGGGGWYTSDVTVSWQYTAGPSQIANPLCVPTKLTADTAGTPVACSVTSGAGLKSTQSLTVKRDTTSPAISGLPAPGTCTIWPPDKAMVTVASVTASDTNGSGLNPASFLVTGTSNEPQSPNNSDIVIQGGVVQVRADRLGDGNGRIYAITATAADVAGNNTTATAQCTVPHSQGGK